MHVNTQEGTYDGAFGRVGFQPTGGGISLPRPKSRPPDPVTEQVKGVPASVMRTIEELKREVASLRQEIMAMKSADKRVVVSSGLPQESL